MNIIDQRILIPTFPDVVWGYVSELGNNPDWQADCRSISFLTSARTGKDVRWRGKAKNGREYVVQITAWYDRMGYEYKIVDGAPFKENLGRIRLQEVPEGTIVQWTFRYQMSGVLRGIRNTVSTKRNVENAIVNSLWALWRRVTEVKPDAQNTNYTSKSLMRDAPDVQERSQYVPRHPSLVIAAKPQQEEVTIEEPPISDDDTRPHDVTPAQAGEPVEVGPPEPKIAEITDDKSKHPLPSSEQPGLEQFQPSVTSSAQPKQHTPAASMEAESRSEDVPKAPIPEASAAQSTTPALPELDSDIDTSRVSVFDLFGVQKPDRESPVTTPPDTKKPSSSGATPSITTADDKQSPDKDLVFLGGRIGMRIKLRRKKAVIRRPK
jgi:hypothetical protein